MSFNMILDSVFSDLIAAEFDSKSNKLRIEYDGRYEHRHAFGLSSQLDDDRLEDEWRFQFNKIVKQRNWLWYMCKNCKYVELDEYFGTDFTFENMNLRLQIEHELQCKNDTRFKYINRQPKFVNFSVSGLDVEELDLSSDSEVEIPECVNQGCSQCKVIYRKNKNRVSKDKYLKSIRHLYNEALNPIYKPTVEPIPLDHRDYNMLYSISLKLRNIIRYLESLREKCIIPSILRRKSSLEEYVMEPLSYQGSGFPTHVKGDSGMDLRKKSNKPQCCAYCPTIVCMTCFKGEGCCDCRHVKYEGSKCNNQRCYLDVCQQDDPAAYQGGVEQDVGGDTDVVQTFKAHNVVLTETERSQHDSTAVSNPRWGSLVSSDTISDMDTLVNRWFRVGTYSWTTSLGRNATIRSINLPRDAIFAGVSTCNQPNTIPFRIHRYWRGDMIVKIHVNCNKFQIGQLQCSWYYQPKADAAFTFRNNVYTRSGTHHCIISAAPNNEVELRIPYKAYKSMYHTKTFAGDQKDLPLDLGTLFITVLSPLKTTGETSPRCSFTVFVKFENNEFTGMLAGDVDVPSQARDDLEYQMDGVGSLLSTAVPLVEKMLVGSGNDNNRDNPPQNNPPNYFVPTASHSWSIGTDIVEPLHNLRLSGRAQTRHPDSDPDEMRVDVLKRKYMLCDIFSWSQQNMNGNVLWSYPVNPIPPKSRIPVVAQPDTNVLRSYQITPIGFLSSLFQYWRGSIEYRFDIVASQFHSGKLLLAYIPGIGEGEVVTIDQARASPHIVISLDNAMTYTWKVPYVADRPWWPRRYAGESVSNNVASPSKIFAFVLNELVMAETVPDSVEILVYMRGGEDMEFAVPVQPSIGLGYDRNYVSSRNTSDVFPVSTTSEFYVGHWHSAPLVHVLRHAATSEAVGRFSEPILDRPAYYTLSRNLPNANVGVSITLRSISTFVFLKGIGFSEYISLPIYSNNSLDSRQRLEDIARAAFSNGYTYGAWVSQFVITQPNTASVNGFGFIPASYTPASNTYGGGKTIPFIATEVNPSIELEDLEFQGNREESLALIDDTQRLRSTNHGMYTYGEKFQDLKDLGRRYQIYGWTTVPKNQIERDPGACSFLFPVLPQGLSLAVNTSTTVNQIWNRAREGHIPLIASLYRFYRGSLRIRIVVSNAPDLIVWVQHRPDRRLDRDVITPCTQVSTAEAVFNHTYGVYMQALRVNNVIEIEVPYYQMANYGLLQKPIISEGPTVQDWSRFYSLGELSVGFFGEQPSADVRCTIYYSMADDCRFTTYQGVPPMVLLDDLPEFQGNMELQFQGFTDYFKSSPKEVGAQIAEGAAETIYPQVQSMLDDFVTSFQSKIGDAYSSVAESLKSIELTTKLASIGSQIIHAINNPSPSTIAISVVSILITLGLITMVSYTIVSKYVIDIWHWIMNKVSSNKVQVEVGIEATEGELQYHSDTDNAVTGFLSIICGGLCTLFGMKNSIKYKPASDCLFKEISNGMRMSNVCFVFFRNLMSVIGDMKAMVVSYVYPGFNAAESLMEGKDIIEKWAEQSLGILDPIVSQNIKYNRDLHIRLIDCYAFGKILKVKASVTQFPGIIQMVNNIFDKLHKLYVDLIAQGIDPHVRKLPFVIYNYGAPEIGKSHLTTNICSALCKDQGITTETSLMCVLNATSKFWDDCDRQPCLVMDDAFNIKKGPMFEDQVAAIFNIVSPVVLVPPKAAVEDKGRPYNPEIFVLNSNTDFQRTEVCEQIALWRRRDILIKSELDPDFVKPDCIHCQQKLRVDSRLPKEAIVSLKDFHHLRFKYTFDVTNPGCAYLPENRYMKYDELINLLKEIFKKNREAENYKFAERVARCNEVVNDFPSLVSNVDNLETLWNEAILKRQASVELVKNSTLSSISKHFAAHINEKWSDCKHGVFKSIYKTLYPGRNIYDLMNPTCGQCIAIKHQCISCQISYEKLLKQSSTEPTVTYHPSPSTSASSIEILFSDKKTGPLKYEGCTIEEVEDDEPTPSTSKDVSTPVFDHDIKYVLSESGQRWLKDLNTQYHANVLRDFKLFLDFHQSGISVALRRYPVYARNGKILKEVCEKFCTCLHNSKSNPPIIYKGKFAFINPTSPDVPDVIESLVCDMRCWMCLPWIHHRIVDSCLSIRDTLIESWMCCMNDRHLVFDKISFDNIMSKLTKWVWDFYYNQMKPAAKAAFTFLTSVQGWLISAVFLTTIFSTVVLGVGTYEACTTAGSGNLGRAMVDMNTMGSGRPPQRAGIGYQAKSYDASKPKVTKAPKAKVHTPVRATNKAEYQSAQQFEVVQQRLRNNMSSIDVVFTNIEGKEVRVRNYGLMLRDQQMLIQRHYYDFWRRLDLTAKFYFNNKVVKLDNVDGILLNNFFDLEIDWFMTPDLEYFDSNFGILHLPKIVPAFKDLTRFIAKSNEHQYIKFDECYLYSSLSDTNMHCVMNVEHDREVTDSNGWLRLSECYSYKYSTVGLCGSALLCSTLERPIIGIHFAGTKTFGFAEPISYESFNDLKVTHYEYQLCDLRLDGKEAAIEFDTLLYPQGTVPEAYKHHQGSVSQYIPSLIHGAYEVDTEPNPLSPKDTRLPPGNPPLKRGVEHMGRPPLDFPNKLLDPAADDLNDVILRNVKPIRNGVGKLSLQDAICGNVNVKGFEPLEWSSSEGFPLKSLRPPHVKGKKWLFDLEETSNGYVLKGMHGELKRQLIVCEQLRRQGIRCATLFVDCLKDTCIDIKKCSIPGKTRIFSISPVQYTIAFKQYFGDFIASYQEARLSAEHGIGINVDSLEWSQVANYITTYGDNIIAGDYKNFGPSLMLKCVEKAFDIIMNWYERYDNDEERQLIRRVLLSEILHAQHLCLNVVYGVPCGIPSGSPITTPLNSLVNSLYLRCGWKSITNQNFSTMHENVRILTYGDDVCINVSDMYKDIYNTETLSLFFKEYNIVFTDIDKSDVIIKYRNLNNVSFLKRSFILHPNSKFIFLAPIELQSIRKCVNWITRKGDPLANTLENCKQACELAFGHGPQYYGEVREFLEKECMKRTGKCFIAPRWYEKSEICYNI
ncbi:polyprotein [Antheraea pernyi iflavirus]|uniref:Genome polyprotein n=1 Tax=Antheraea pernyi iflavirus TaxID=1460071 RepID=W6CLS3_9VIRU|nr:polyprotein [Antheraea pernyi iflavirus]AHI87751.1 polyprotein [Antheraea pernyi iflavirus]